MVREEGIVKYKRGRKQKDGGRIYIIRYTNTWGTGEKEIRLHEEKDTDASFHRGDKITVEINDDSITVHNQVIGISVTGTKV